MSLFSLCLDFVSSNISDVDSLIDFPQLVGLQLFNGCVQKKQFCDARKNVKARQTLKIFFDAYGDNGILDDLNLQNCHLFVNDILVDYTWLLSNLVQLDLSSCKLGDDHELLTSILNLNRLENLNLHNNCLTDRGIRQGTLRLRFKKQINNCLKNLDLSANNVTCGCLLYLQPFKCLSVVIVSRSWFDSKWKTLKFEISEHFKYFDACTCINSTFSIVTKGWASQVIEGWKKEYFVSKDLPLTTSLMTAQSKVIPHGVKSFYSKVKIVSEAIQKSTLPPVSPQNIMLTTDLFHCQHISSNRLSVDLINSSQKHQDQKKRQKSLAYFKSVMNTGEDASRKRSSECGYRRDTGHLIVDVKKSRLMQEDNVEEACHSLLDIYNKGDKPLKKNSKGALLNELSDWN